MTEPPDNLTVRLLQEMRVENAARDEKTQTGIAALHTDLQTFRAETNTKFGILAEAIMKQSHQLELVSMTIDRHTTRLDRIEQRLDGVEKRLGLDQTNH